MSWDEKEFKEKLEGAHTFPDTYIFKFIVKQESQSQVEGLVSGAEISVKPSSGNKYVSVTLKARMESSSDVVEVYRNAKQIEGLIAL